MRKLLLALGVASLVLPASAQAHFNLTMPPTIGNSIDGKGNAPCGPDTATNGTPTAVTGGTMLPIVISETVIHAGFYRFALSLTSPPSFPADNVVKDKNGMVLAPSGNGVSDTAEFEDPAKFPVLADHLFVHTGGKAPLALQGGVPIPNINCDKCTLQVIEFMSNHGSNGMNVPDAVSAGFFYHHCALLKITADPNKPIFDPNASAGGAGGSGAGGASAAAGSSGAAGAATVGTGGGGTSGSVGVSGGGASAAGASAAAGASTAGAPASAGAASGGSAGAQPSFAGDTPDGGGCSLSHRGSGSTVPALALLLGLFALGRRRRAHG